jgi:hypothetical protein
MFLAFDPRQWACRDVAAAFSRRLCPTAFIAWWRRIKLWKWKCNTLDPNFNYRSEKCSCTLTWHSTAAERRRHGRNHQRKNGGCRQWCSVMLVASAWAQAGMRRPKDRGDVHTAFWREIHWPDVTNNAISCEQSHNCTVFLWHHFKTTHQTKVWRIKILLLTWHEPRFARWLISSLWLPHRNISYKKVTSHSL